MDGLVPTELGPLERTPSKADLRALWRDQRPFTVAGRPGVSCLAKLTTITNKPSGVSPADVGPRLNGLPQLLELKRDPLLLKSSSNQDLINAVAPDFYELQRWASRGGGSESVAASCAAQRCITDDRSTMRPTVSRRCSSKTSTWWPT